MRIAYSRMATPLGELWIGVTQKGVCHIGLSGEESFFAALRRLFPEANLLEDGGATREAARQLGEYFSGKRRTFTLPLDLRGTPFQRTVWEELRKVPFGTTVTYGELARRIGKPRAVRAVGQANHRNPVPIVVPCHRVIGHDGSLVGFGSGLELKRRLLEHEGIAVSGEGG